MANALLLDEIIDEALVLDIPLRRSQGRKAPLTLAHSRDLTEADLAILSAGGLGSKPQAVLRLKHTHHSIARYLAEGRKEVEISAITGFTPGRISVLQSDPAFKELVAYYRGQVEEVFVDFQARLASLGLDTLEELAARLEEDPTSFKNRELMELAAMMADRSGHGPTSKVQHNHAHFSEDILRRIKEEASSQSRSTVKTLELTAEARPQSDLGGTGREPGV